MPQDKIRVGVIGHTGRGNYGHGLDVCWLEMPEVEIVGVADPDDEGRAKAMKKLGAPKGFADYREMMDETKPHIVAICPRHADQHRDMFLAAAERGISAYCEKPMCRDLVEADEMAAACQEHGVKLAVAHLTRYAPALQVVANAITEGKIGTPLEIRARGKEDRRGGCEDLWVLGSHLLNTMHYLGGEPDWCFGRVEQDGKRVTKEDIVEGNEGLGPMGGNAVHAMWGLSGGMKGYFGSVRNNPGRYGLQIFGSEGIIDLREGYVPPAHFLPDPKWCPPLSGSKWLNISSQGIGKPETMDKNWRLPGNVAAARDLIAAIRDDREPECSVHEGRMVVGMILSVFASHKAGGPVDFPLELRKNALGML